jgi:integrase
MEIPQTELGGETRIATRKSSRLTAAAVRAAKTGRHGDGNGLSLIVTGPDRKHWQFRYMRSGRGREMSLGNAAHVTLAEARQKAADARTLLAKGIDPLDEREAAKASRQPAAARTFASVAEAYIVTHQASWRNDKHRYQWRQSLANYAYPVIGDMDVAAIQMEDVVGVLRPIWTTKTETASRLRGRIETILAFATVSRWRAGSNPATWRGNLAMVLPAPDKVARVEHLAALPWQDMPAFWVDLAQRDGAGKLALQFAILTAARSGEVRGCRWGEIDTSAGVWTVPAARMKAGKVQRVPLSDAALDILKTAANERHDNDLNALLFPGLKRGEPMSDATLTAVLRRMGRGDVTVHGFRSMFRDWAAEQTDTANHVVEQALAHAIPGSVEAAYRRGDLLEKRRGLMEAWAAYCTSRVAKG